MATLTAGSSVTLGMDAWASLTLVVSGKATLAFTSGAPNLMSDFNVSQAQSKTYGPFGVPMSVVVSAVDRTLTYSVDGQTGGFGYDDNGNPASLVSGAGNVLIGPFARNVASGTKFLGAAKGGVAVNVSTGLSSSVFSLGAKIAVEGDFVGVRVVIINRATNALNNNRVIIGVTETGAIDTNANRESVVIGGTAYAQLAPANTVNGFFPVTFAGAATVSLAAATTAVQFAISDRIPLTSVPRADGGTLPLIQVRMDHDGSADGSFCFFSTAAASAMRTSTAANRGRIIQMYTGTALAATPANVGSIGTTAFEIFVVPDYTDPAISVMGSGDSIVDCSGISADIFSSWGFRGCADASTSGRRVSWMNMGGSSMDATNNWARCQEIINAGIVPDVLVIQPASVNDNSGVGWTTTSNLPALVQKSKARAVEIAQYASNKGIKRVIMVPILPLNAQDATQSAARVAFNSWLSSLCAARGLSYLSVSALGDGAAAEKWVPAYNNAADGIHPNEAAFEAVLAPALTTLLRTVGV